MADEKPTDLSGLATALDGSLPAGGVSASF